MLRQDDRSGGGRHCDAAGSQVSQHLQLRSPQGGALRPTSQPRAIERRDEHPTTGSGTFYLSGASQLSGTIAAGERVIGYSANLVATGGLTNEGEIGLGAPLGDGDTFLFMGGFSLTNNGTLFVESGSGTQRAIFGDVLNQGTIDIRTSAVFDGRITNNRSINIAAAQSLTLRAGGMLRNVAPGSAVRIQALTTTA